MQIVIEIDNEHYERIMRFEEGVTVYPTTLALYEAVKNGKPLPKGHGRLIDADAINTHDISPIRDMEIYGVTEYDIDAEPTIIEA